MTERAPPCVGSVETYWGDPPPEPSARLLYWLRRIDDGWRPNRRIRSMGYYEKARFFGVFLWEYLNTISPRLSGNSR